MPLASECFRLQSRVETSGIQWASLHLFFFQEGSISILCSVIPQLSVFQGYVCIDLKLQAASQGLYKLLVVFVQSVEAILTKFNASSEASEHRFEDYNLNLESCFDKIDPF